MKKNISIISLLAITSILFTSAALEKSSSGAPASHTGAPGEKTCAASGCHDDNAVNAGSAKLTIEVGNKETSFVPGKTYSVKIKISDKDVSRFGFQLVVLDPASLSNCGTLLIRDSLRTKLVSNAYAMQDRKYATYSFNGTDATSDGMSEWVVNWTAPEGKISNADFYVSAVSANDNMNDKGDHVYTKKLNLNAKKN
ncbi:choice-of-anchor V domain-containing protein [Aurantibacillus circumpalustris]|uniref:choice-of-anchor V domain-containing protein n=1 Tax=Aurantibacillus circumpalustris TaxID=3036359 RepID=UPI00295B8A34|nr:choice-of-anchor V domain-containing protein [Aurantibacillus circumpalustris]